MTPIFFSPAAAPHRSARWGFQVALRSRCTAMLAGLPTLIQTRHGPSLAGAIDLLRHDALGLEPARMGEHGRPIIGDALVEEDARPVLQLSR
jgi:hypothetical protein